MRQDDPLRGGLNYRVACVLCLRAGVPLTAAAETAFMRPIVHFLSILRRRCAECGNARQIAATQAQPKTARIKNVDRRGARLRVMQTEYRTRVPVRKGGSDSIPDQRTSATPRCPALPERGGPSWSAPIFTAALHMYALDEGRLRYLTHRRPA